MLLEWLVAFSVVAATPQSGAQAPDPWFDEVAEARGIDFVHVRGLDPRFLFPEIMSGGAGWLDYDGDGDLDLYLVQGGDLRGQSDAQPGNRLYRNEGGIFRDVTARAGVGDRGYGMGVAVGDVDGDGWIDIYVTNLGTNALYRNLGNGAFDDSTATSGLGDPGWGASASFLDYDRDGDLDLFLANYVHWTEPNEIECFAAGGRRDYCHPHDYQAPAADRLYRNNGLGVFTDVSERAGLGTTFGNGLGLAVADFDLDGWLDLYVANDGMPNQLWRNRGDGTFRDVAVPWGCAVNMSGSSEAGMGVSAIDADQDGSTDLFITHLRQETNTLYLNRGGYCEDATASLGLAAPSINRTGFGHGLADFDHDGRLDLYVANGRVGRDEGSSWGSDPFAEPDQVFRGVMSGGFVEVDSGSRSALSAIGSSRAAAFADYDSDGDMDLLVVDNGGRARLLENSVGKAGRWIEVRFAQSATEPLGSRLRLRSAGKQQWRQVQRTYSYCASNDPRAHFGLGDADRVEELLVLPLVGTPLSLRELQVGRSYVLPALGSKRELP